MADLNYGCMLCRAYPGDHPDRDFIRIPARSDGLSQITVERLLRRKDDGGDQMMSVDLAATANREHTGLDNDREQADFILCWPDCWAKTITPLRDDFAREIAKLMEDGAQGEMPEN